MTVLYFLATIVLLVVIHEWGHFATARFFGVGVRSFTVGFGKQFVSWVDPKTGTSWGIAPYPVGGYVGLLGEKDAADAAEQPTVTGKPFMNAPLHAKLVILFAGPFVNLLFAALLYAVLAYSSPNPALPILATPPAGGAAARGRRANSELDDGEWV
jgi:regulator of sigma E protease